MTTIKFPLTVQLSHGQIEQLKQIPGVTEVKLSADDQVIISLDEEKNESISQILNKISGFDPDLTITESDFPVEKLSCDGCASSAERLLSHQPGVVTASVKFPTRSAKIYYLQNKTTPLKLKVALEQLGYELVVDGGKENERK